MAAPRGKGNATPGDSLLVEAVRLMASRDAADDDGVGFNRFDAPLGLSLAGTSPEQWSIYQVQAAHRMLAKYTAQLAELGIDYRQIPQPDGGVERPARRRSVGVSSGGQFVIGFPYDAELVEEVKELPGRSFDRESKTWLVPARHEALGPLVDFMAYRHFDYSGEVVALIEKLSAAYERNVRASRARSSELEVEGLSGELMPFQRAGVEYALHARRTFIADQMGLGKTVQSLATVQAAGAFPALVVCPASVKLNWAREAAQWISSRTVEVLEGTAGEGSAGADITLINYDILDAHADRLIGRDYSALILDESHYIKNRKVKRTARAKELARGPAGSEGPYIRLLLSGTPLLSRPEELIPQLEVLGRLGDLGGFWRFANLYCAAREGPFGWDLSGAQNLSELNDNLRASCFIRRTKDEVLSDLPAKQRAVVPMELANAEDYREAEADLVSYMGECAANDRRRIARAIAGFEAENGRRPDERERSQLVLRVRGGAEARAEANEQLVRIGALRRMCALGKLDGVVRWVKEFLNSTDQKLVLFGAHREVVFAVAERFGAPSITGDDNAASKQAAVDRFQSDPGCRLLVANIAAGGVGITLTAASDVAFIELGWTPAIHDQAEDRCHRIGQQSSVTAWYLLGFATIDGQIHDLIERKRLVVDAATEGAALEGASDEEGSVYDDLMDRLAARGGGLEPVGSPGHGPR